MTLAQQTGRVILKLKLLLVSCQVNHFSWLLANLVCCVDQQSTIMFTYIKIIINQDALYCNIMIVTIKSIKAEKKLISINISMYWKLIASFNYHENLYHLELWTNCLEEIKFFWSFGLSFYLKMLINLNCCELLIIIWINYQILTNLEI